jgi:hypothetical protein
MPDPKIEYSEYQSVVNLLQQSDQNNVYQGLMEKEKKTLETVNKVVKYYTETNFKKKEFLNLSFNEIILNFSETWMNIISDLLKIKSFKNFNIKTLKKTFLSKDRSIYIGLMFIFVSFFLIFLIK